MTVLGIVLVLPWRAWRASEVLAVSIQVGAFLAAENFASSTKKHLVSSNGLTIGIFALGLDALPGGTADSLIEIGGPVEHCSSHVRIDENILCMLVYDNNGTG